MKKSLGIVLGMCLIGSITACSDQGVEQSVETANQQTTNQDITINFGLPPYPHSDVIMNIMKEISEQRGYEVNFVEGDIGFMFVGLAQGDIDVFPDAWLPVLHSSYIERYEDEIEIIGVLEEEVALGLAVPSYAPFDSVEELGDNAELFDNKIIGIEPSAGMMLTTQETLEAYGLEDEIELLSASTPAMLAELDKATRNEDVIVFMGWRPHTMFSNYDIKLLDDPKGIWAYDNIEVAVNKDFQAKAPDLYEFLTEFKLSADDMEDILARVDEGEELEELTSEWVEQNQKYIDSLFED